MLVFRLRRRLRRKTRDSRWLSQESPREDSQGDPDGDPREDHPPADRFFGFPISEVLQPVSHRGFRSVPSRFTELSCFNPGQTIVCSCVLSYPIFLGFSMIRVLATLSSRSRSAPRQEVLGPVTIGWRMIISVCKRIVSTVRAH